MAALSADGPQLDTRPSGVSARSAYAMTTSTTIYANSLVGVNDAGFVVPWADTANYEFVGLALARSCTRALLSSPAEQVRVDTSGVIIRSATVAAAVQGSVGELVYCATDNPADLVLSGPSNVGPIGHVIRFVSAGVADVQLFTPGEHLATN